MHTVSLPAWGMVGYFCAGNCGAAMALYANFTKSSTEEGTAHEISTHSIDPRPTIAGAMSVPEYVTWRCLEPDLYRSVECPNIQMNTRSKISNSTMMHTTHVQKQHSTHMFETRNSEAVFVNASHQQKPEEHSKNNLLIDETSLVGSCSEEKVTHSRNYRTG